MKINPNYILQEVAQQYIVVPTGTSAIDFNGVITLNKSAKLLFEALQDEKTTDELISLLMTHYEVDETLATHDVNEFIKILKDKNILL